MGAPESAPAGIAEEVTAGAFADKRVPRLSSRPVPFNTPLVAAAIAADFAASSGVYPVISLAAPDAAAEAAIAGIKLAPPVIAPTAIGNP